ncbi:hypothetical protein ACA910_000230 [Epithemia clementina (nom. ined.)]
MVFVLTTSEEESFSMKQSLNSYPQDESVGGIVCVSQPQTVGQDDACYGEVYQYHSDDPETILTRPMDANNDHFDVLESCDSSIPFAFASLEPLLPSNAGEGSHEGEVIDVSAQPVDDFSQSHPSSIFVRPEFLYATAIKPSVDSPIGITFKKKNAGVYISKVDPHGLFRKSGLQSGDRLVAVNNINCISAPLRMVREMIESSESSISLCARNKYGDPHSVLNSVQKPKRDCKLGICFQTKRGALTVSKVRENGLFARSLLMPDHRCYMINGQACDTMDAYQAADLTASVERVTIISRARGDLAIVLSVGEVQRWSAVALGAGVAVAALSALGSMS